jgi:hypothetical protein
LIGENGRAHFPKRIIQAPEGFKTLALRHGQAKFVALLQNGKGDPFSIERY